MHGPGSMGGYGHGGWMYLWWTCGIAILVLLQRPTLITLVMFPILMTMYVRLARREEQEVAAEFGQSYRELAAATPVFIPHLGANPERAAKPRGIHHEA